MGSDTGAEAVDLAVREWIAREFPGQLALAENAARLATSAYLTGDTVGEACGAALGYVRSWRDHPAHRHVGPATASLVS